ncbi:MAG: hypothetical protein ACTSXZ_10180 [Alphaproteobacteria bacterium]
MAARNPWCKFYFSDWRSDPKLRMCSLAARGLWMEMLAIMDEASPRGYLTVSGCVPTDAQLAVLAGAPLDQLPDILGELEATGVFSRTGAGVIFSRRFIRDEKNARKSRKNGKLGGNPTLGKQRGIPPWDNPQDKLPDKTQKLEARSQKPERKKERKHSCPDRESSQSGRADFEAWWILWTIAGTKRGRGHASTAYAKARNLATHDELSGGVIRYMAWCAEVGQPVSKIKHPTTWLNAQSWADDLPSEESHNGRTPPNSGDRSGRGRTGETWEQQKARSRVAILAGLADELETDGRGPGHDGGD